MVNEISMVELDILLDIAIKLEKACGISNHKTVVFGVLPIAIVMSNFYQFPPIGRRALWVEPKTDDDGNSKTL